VREAATELVENPRYRANLEQRLVAGKLAPAMETLLWHFAYGKPKESMQTTKYDLKDDKTLDRVSDAELEAEGPGGPHAHRGLRRSEEGEEGVMSNQRVARANSARGGSANSQDS